MLAGSANSTSTRPIHPYRKIGNAESRTCNTSRSRGYPMAWPPVDSARGSQSASIRNRRRFLIQHGETTAQAPDPALNLPTRGADHRCWWSALHQATGQRFYKSAAPMAPSTPSPPAPTSPATAKRPTSPLPISSSPRSPSGPAHHSRALSRPVAHSHSQAEPRAPMRRRHPATGIVRPR